MYSKYHSVSEPTALPEDIKQKMKESLRDMSRVYNGTFTDKQLADARTELKYEMKRLNVKYLESEINEIMHGIEEGSWIRKTNGPFLSIIDQILQNVNSEAELLCKQYLEADNPTKLNYCVIQNRDLLVANLVINQRSDNQSFFETLRNMVHDEEIKHKPTK